MAQPKTHLLISPDKANPFGRGIPSSELVKGLKEANPQFVIPEPDSYPGWYPGKAAGMTCIWLGQPAMPGSKKICGFHLGEVPEYTQIAPDGSILRRGWRAIFERVIVAGFCDKTKLETLFKCKLEYAGTSQWCQRCARKAEWVEAQGEFNLCLTHEAAERAVRAQRAIGDEAKYQLKKSGRDPHALHI